MSSSSSNRTAKIIELGVELPVNEEHKMPRVFRVWAEIDERLYDAVWDKIAKPPITVKDIPKIAAETAEELGMDLGNAVEIKTNNGPMSTEEETAEAIAAWKQLLESEPEIRGLCEQSDPSAAYLNLPLQQQDKIVQKIKHWIRSKRPSTSEDAMKSIDRKNIPVMLATMKATLQSYGKK